MVKMFKQYKNKLVVGVYALLAVLVGSVSNGWCVDLLTGADFSVLATNVMDTAIPIVIACLPLLGFIIAVRYGKKIVSLFAR